MVSCRPLETFRFAQRVAYELQRFNKDVGFYDFRFEAMQASVKVPWISNMIKMAMEDPSVL